MDTISWDDQLTAFIIEAVRNILVVTTAVTKTLAIYIMLGILTYFFTEKVKATQIQLPSSPAQSRKRRKSVQRKKRVLFIIAHPDDECMFFGPTILSLIKTCEVYLLCLSNGNHYNKGDQRKEELWASCKVLGIPASNITLMNNTQMPDDPNVEWKSETTCKLFLDFIHTMDIKEVYTFDEDGVSGHINHISIFLGFARMCLKKLVPQNCKVYTLESVNLLRNYTAFSDAAVSKLLFGKHMFMSSLQDSEIIRKAMQEHESQYVWYRQLHVYFSRYMYINTYRELEFDDITLLASISDHFPLM